jgi:hypothetical protein
MNWGYGLKTAKMGIANTGIVKDMPLSTGKRNMYVYDLNAGEYIRLRGVDFGTRGAKQVMMTAASTGTCQLVIRLDAVDGPVVATLNVKSTGNLEKYKQFVAKTTAVQGVHDLYICVEQVQGDVRLDWWQFKN